jgi:hypothetical protein
MCSLCLSFMWSALFATLFSNLDQPMSSSDMIMLLLVAANPVVLVVCGVLSHTLSLTANAPGTSPRKSTPKWPPALAFIV